MKRRVIAIDFAQESELWQALPQAEAIVTAAVSAAVAGAGLEHAPGAELSVVLTDDAGIAKINAAWRGLDKPTNVLSFPLAAPQAIAGAPMLGDIIFAYETLDREAVEAGRPLAHTPGASSPAESGYVVAVLVVSAVGLLSAVVGYVLVPRTAGRTAEGDRIPLAVES